MKLIPLSIDGLYRWYLWSCWMLRTRDNKEKTVGSVETERHTHCMIHDWSNLQTPPPHSTVLLSQCIAKAYSIVQTPHSSSRQTLPTCRGLLVLLISTMITLTTMLRIITSIMMLTTIAFIGKPFASVISETELSNYTLFLQVCFQRGQFL